MRCRFLLPVLVATALSGCKVTPLPRSFRSWCEDKTLSPDSAHTVQVLLDRAGSANCATAESALQLRASLDLSHSGVGALEPLSALTRLQYLKLANNGLTDVGALASLKWLHFLDLGGNPLQNTAPLGALASLERLSLRGTLVQDVSPLAGLAHLRILDLSFTAARDLRSLYKLDALQVLYLRGVPGIDPGALPFLHLQALDLGEAGLTDARRLTALPGVQYLDLDGNQLDDVSPLASRQTLVFLRLAHNLILDFSPLASLFYLRSVWVFGNPGVSTCTLPAVCRFGDPGSAAARSEWYDQWASLDPEVQSE